MFQFTENEFDLYDYICRTDFITMRLERGSRIYRISHPASYEVQGKFKKLMTRREVAEEITSRLAASGPQKVINPNYNSYVLLARPFHSDADSVNHGVMYPVRYDPSVSPYTKKVRGYYFKTDGGMRFFFDLKKDGKKSTAWF